MTLLTREPGARTVAKIFDVCLSKVRSIDGTLWQRHTPHTAARRSHLIDLIEPARQTGTGCYATDLPIQRLPIKDMVTPDLDFIAELQSKIIKGAEPQLTVLLDISVDQARESVRHRGTIIARYERMDRSIHEKIRKGF